MKPVTDRDSYRERQRKRERDPERERYMQRVTKTDRK